MFRLFWPFGPCLKSGHYGRVIIRRSFERRAFVIIHRLGWKNSVSMKKMALESKSRLETIFQ
jgi:hypothetical protein